MTNYAVTRADVEAAAERISGMAHLTPVVTCATLDEMTGRRLFFKCEQFQKVGAFKFRGACNAVSQLSAEELSRGVVTHSSGNHAQALALAAKTNNAPAHIVMPTTAPQVKRAAVAGYGANIVDCEPNIDARETTAAAVQQQTGAVFIHPFNHPHIIAGQGTVALELVEQAAEHLGEAPLDAIIAPVGGGGLISGICAAVHPQVRVFAAEPELAGDAFQSKSTGRLHAALPPASIADGLLTGLADLTWPYVRDQVEQVITVSEQQIIDAMRLLWERAKLLIEPSAATVLAAVLSGKMPPDVQRIGLVLTGGNVDLARLPFST